MTANSMHETTSLKVNVPANYETIAWRWMRYSGVLLIPLVWGHTILQDVVVGVHAMDINYVAMRWASLGWRIYDSALLAFAFAHGVNGLRQVAFEFFKTPKARRNLSWLLLIFWAVVTAIGAGALIGGVRLPQ